MGKKAKANTLAAWLHSWKDSFECEVTKNSSFSEITLLRQFPRQIESGMIPWHHILTLSLSLSLPIISFTHQKSRRIKTRVKNLGGKKWQRKIRKPEKNRKEKRRHERYFNSRCFTSYAQQQGKAYKKWISQLPLSFSLLNSFFFPSKNTERNQVECVCEEGRNKSNNSEWIGNPETEEELFSSRSFADDGFFFGPKKKLIMHTVEQKVVKNNSDPIA